MAQTEMEFERAAALFWALGGSVPHAPELEEWAFHLRPVMGEAGHAALPAGLLQRRAEGQHALHPHCRRPRQGQGVLLLPLQRKPGLSLPAVAPKSTAQSLESFQKSFPYSGVSGSMRLT